MVGVNDLRVNEEVRFADNIRSQMSSVKIWFRSCSGGLGLRGSRDSDVTCKSPLTKGSGLEMRKFCQYYSLRYCLGSKFKGLGNGEKRLRLAVKVRFKVMVTLGFRGHS